MKFFVVCILQFTAILLNAQISTINKNKTTTQTLKPLANYYRVVAKGFICNRETADDVLERDGKRDEIYLASQSVLFDDRAYSIPSTVVKNRSRTLGDVNGRASHERRVMAGSADGKLGGIKTGDHIPDIDPWKNNATAKGDLLPFVIWEGELPAGRSVIITPSIFEWDGPADFFTNLWHNSFVGQLARGAANVASLPYKLVTQGINTSNEAGLYDDGTPGVYAPFTVTQNFRNFYKVDIEGIISPAEKDRFIKQNSVNAGMPGDRPVGLVKQAGMDVYNPLSIMLDGTAFEKLTNRNFGYGIGIIPVRYKDGAGLDGDYTVFYSFEKVTEGTEKNKINISSSDVFSPSAGYKLHNTFAPDFTTDLLNGGDVVVMNADKNLRSEKWYIRKSANEGYFVFTNLYNEQLLFSSGDPGGYAAKTSAGGGSEIAMIRYCDGSWIIRLSNGSQSVLQTRGLNIQPATPVVFGAFSFMKSQRWWIGE